MKTGVIPGFFIVFSEKIYQMLFHMMRRVWN